MKFRDIVDVIDLEQEIKVYSGGSEVYSGQLEEMKAGQLLLVEQDEVEELETDEGLVIMLKDKE